MLEPTPVSNPLNGAPSMNHGGVSLLDVLGWGCLIWYTCVVAVCALGYCQIWNHFSRRPHKSYAASASDAPHVTVIRPVKGLEPYLYECLAATFRQDYPRDKMTVCFCVASKDDPAYPVLRRLVDDFPHADVRLYVEEEDPLLQDDSPYTLGPNPKIRNMSRAYREAKGDVVWIVDCNIWVGRGVCGRMVDKLCGYGPAGNKPHKKYKFVHHLPIAVDVNGRVTLRDEQEALLGGHAADNDSTDWSGDLLAAGGGRLEELFLSSSHAKMYTAINTVLIAPCIVGKSNMFRRSHLDPLTAPAASDPSNHPHGVPRHPGIDYFSDNICEDHLIGDLLWKNQIRAEQEQGERWGKHGLVFGDLAIQPVAQMSVHAYWARRVRWQRVRKFTVFLATLVEPGTESLVCSLYGALGVTTSLARFLQGKGIESAAYLSTWPAFVAFYFASLLTWIFVDWTLYLKLHSAQTVEVDENTPFFARPVCRSSPCSTSSSSSFMSPPTARRPFLHWLAAWLGREGLALPVWVWAFYGGVTVDWRDRRFRVGLDMKVREINSSPYGSRKVRCD
ncbi:hypothetical protein ASPZODRAFT_1597957 [Penicilliopsis zonata CBS 506.65]|uniref:Ceramide glucosyltransferase n=1 Tax=Penicilliopsis zonata CBS 506.65 TaxID=1073090 RepID=A0A1L9SMU5_9EURO|nr:hypothetical protein ASPZODRAFT_1597957 [Penicilliopsis zonata CBS 506.65]OJJ48436.1 hypothetical protein ASPZODRAFT_1597957 [Penicilliopsis zonata CBS 506.65]